MQQQSVALSLVVIQCLLNIINCNYAASTSTTLKCRNRHQTRLPLNIPSSQYGRKSNIVFILTDDQDIELGSLSFMPRTQSLLKSQGAEFRHAYATTPMCCPSRSSILTGQYMHNHHVYTNNDNCSSPYWQKYFENRSFATYIHDSGYQTAYFGKYLNKYNGSYIPNGWGHWSGLIMNSKYYNYTINTNGRKVKHYFDYTQDYYPDRITNESIQFLNEHFADKKPNKPLMMVLSYPSPHGPEDSAPQYSHMFHNVTTHHTPSYNFAPNMDKQWMLRYTPEMSSVQKQFTDTLMTKRLQTLQSIDVAVENVYNTLKSLGQLESTFIFYMSDHGYHLGQFGLVKGKSFPFEFDIRVPFIVRGPGIQPGTVVNDIVLNIDIAPTFLSIAGINTPMHMDGNSFLKFHENLPPTSSSNCSSKKLRNKRLWRDSFLVESSGRRNNKDYEQFMDTTINSEDGHPENQHVSRTSNLKLQRLAFECQHSENLQLPCRPGQKWHCIQEENGTWRKHKCKFSRRQNNHFCKCHHSNNTINTSNRNSNVLEKSDINYNLLPIIFPRHKLIPAQHIHRNSTCNNKINCILKQSVSDENGLKASQNQVDNIIVQLKRKLSNWRKVSKFLNKLQDWKNTTDSFNAVNKNTKCDCERNNHRILVQQKKHRKLIRKLKLGSCLKQGMNCFIHDHNHWKTEPLWKSEPFCFCSNAANNSYSCLRTINGTHNFLYCEFVTRFVTFYDLNIDQFQKENRAHLLSENDKIELHNELESLTNCNGRSCTKSTTTLESVVVDIK